MQTENKIKQFIGIILLLSQLTINAQVKPLPALKVSENHRFLVTKNNQPFFWLADTGWLLFTKLTRAEVITYLNDRQQKGFNVIQVMGLHEFPKAVNVYGDSALINRDISKVKVTIGASFENPLEYDFWDHVDFVIREAEKRGIYIAFVPVWGSNVKAGWVTEKQATVYASFLANRYKNQSNIIWLNGGDLLGTDGEDVWQTIGKTIKAIDPNHLMTFHPKGRNSSSEWFHTASWLDFNLFQSGHKDYKQDTSKLSFGEDNWKYVNRDYALQPYKPTIDGEPSYEHIPHGLHDSLAPIWYAPDIRRYAYWSVFAGGFGFTYGHNAVMQFHNGKGKGDYFCDQNWADAIKDTASMQMQYVKKILIALPYLERVPNQSIVLNQGNRYEYLAATTGKNFALVYTYTGRNMQLKMGVIAGNTVSASWYNPRNGQFQLIGNFKNIGSHEFDPPGVVKEGNDWVLLLKSITAKK
ncbi:MAG: glycoside hydrolase family 140 protein [Bacteroidetes bacterium]|nr:glycoside hydrolase family 140 protein [Bacteroidota bacterium]